MPHVLIVLTSQAQIPATRQQTGWHLPELAHAHEILTPKTTITLASPQGGEPPLEPSSTQPSDTNTDAVIDFLSRRELWTHTRRLREMVVRVGEFDAVFYLGGYGCMFDLVTNAVSLALIQSFAAQGKPIAGVCHGVVALLNATAPSGVSLLAGATVTGFSAEEERLVGMADVMPFQLEVELDRVSGGGYVKAEKPWGEKVVVSTTAGTRSPVITGQNPASVAGVAREILRVLGV